MANQGHLDLMKQGIVVWNSWRKQHPEVRADLTGAYLSEADLSGVNLSGANLSGADLSRADLSEATLSEANLSRGTLSRAYLYRAILIEADLTGADLTGANLSEADLTGADLSRANLSRATLSGTTLSGATLSGATLSEATLSGQDLSYKDLSGADLSGANLSRTTLANTKLTNATLKDCNIYGISAWDVQLDGAEQLNLRITPEDQPSIRVDNLKIAQFIYLLLNNAEIRDVIDTLTTKSVLILGRFTPKRKIVLDALREALRKQNYLPILFDFENPKNRDVTETVRTLAHLARFILADLTDPSSIPLELDTIVPILEVPLQPLLLETKREFSMFVSLTKYDWVLPIYKYKDLPSLLASFENILTDAEKKVDELAIKKAKRLIRQ